MFCFDSFSFCFWGVFLYFSFYISLKTNILQRIASESLLDRFKKNVFFLINIKIISSLEYYSNIESVFFFPISHI